MAYRQCTQVHGCQHRLTHQLVKVHDAFCLPGPSGRECRRRGSHGPCGLEWSAASVWLSVGDDVV
jgi:hypothetical protein